tara:strand:+ start:478 stop:1623 length:1146 start_codon:yes stop_codon:yes gene_type:complete
MDGIVRACCMFELPPQDIPSENHSEKYKLKNLESFDNVLNSDEWKDYRQRIKTENIPNCNWCWKQEKSIKSSKRTEYNAVIPIKDIEPPALRTLEISLDSTCNMMCRICQPSQSSKWASATQVTDEINKTDYSGNRYDTKATVDLSTRDNLKRVFLNSDLTKISQIRINGGEPFYSKNLLPILQKIDNDAGLENVKLEFNTNGSIFPKKDILELLLKAKSIELEFSIDAVGELAEVTRYGVSWETIEQTIEKWKTNIPNASFSVHTVISLLNLSKLNELKEWIHKIGFYNNWAWDFLTSPKHLSVYQLSNENKQVLVGDMGDFQGKDKLYDELMFEGLGNSNNYKLFLEFTKILDKYQSNSFESVNPETYRLIKELYNNKK